MESSAPVSEKQIASAEEKGLPREDKDYLVDVGGDLVRKIAQDYPDVLPDAIILPDTSTRLFSYFLNASLGEVAEYRKTARPNLYFFRSDRSASLDSADIVSELQAADTHEALQKLSQMSVETDDYDASEDLEWKRKNLEAFPAEEGDEKRHTWAKRAEEIKSQLQKKGISNPRMIIVDGHLDLGTTITETRKAFGENMPAYVMSSTFKSPAQEYERLQPLKIASGNARRPGYFLNPLYKEKSSWPLSAVRKDDNASDLYARPIRPELPAEERVGYFKQRATIIKDIRTIGVSVGKTIVGK